MAFILNMMTMCILLVRVNIASDPELPELHKFNHFTVKQCEIKPNSCTKSQHSILIAVDGTGSRLQFAEVNGQKYESRIGINNNEQFIWQSHVANFWEDYKGEKAHYIYGPDSNEMVLAGWEIDDIVEEGHDKICEFVENYLFDHTHGDLEKNELSEFIAKTTESGLFGIDIIGYSRGGFAAMEISRRLQFNGCNKIAPITVRWLGLYDPVEKDLDFSDLFEEYDNGKIAENVLSVSIAERSKFIHSREYFDYAVNEEDHKQYKKRFNASHSGIGGTPGKGDCVEDANFFDDGLTACLCAEEYTVEMDKIASIETEMWMRKNAINSNVPIDEIINPSMFFSNFVDLDD